MTQETATNKVDADGVTPDARTALGAVIMVAIAAVAFAFLFAGIRGASGVFAGGALAVSNLWIMKRIAEAFLSPHGQGRAFWGIAGAIKFAVLLAIVGALLVHRVVDAIPLIIGYGALPLGITLSAFARQRLEPTGGRS